MTDQFSWKWNVPRVNPRLLLSIELSVQLQLNSCDQLGGCKSELSSWKAEFKS